MYFFCNFVVVSLKMYNFVRNLSPKSSYPKGRKRRTNDTKREFNTDP